MKIVLLTQDKCEHCYVANELSRHVALAAIVIDRGLRKSLFNRIAKLFRRYNVLQLMDRMIGKVIAFVCGHKKDANAEMMRVLDEENCREILQKDIVKNVNGINSQQCYELLEGIGPDVILVYGTSIVSDRVLNIASKVALNMHTGISPDYRGSHCAFWPLYNEQLDMLGATVHECVSDIDGGRIFATARANLEEDDTLYSVFAQCVKVGAGIYVDIVKNMSESELEGEKQQLDTGREYRSSLKTWRDELAVRNKINKGLIRDYVKANLDDR